MEANVKAVELKELWRRYKHESDEHAPRAVSYTHLTLPTILLV